MPKVVSSTLLCLFCQTVRYERARITEVNPCKFLSALPLPIATRFLHDGVTCALQISMFRTGLEQGLTARQDHFASLYRDGTDWTGCCCGIECGWGWRGLARTGEGWRLCLSTPTPSHPLSPHLPRMDSGISFENALYGDVGCTVSEALF